MAFGIVTIVVYCCLNVLPHILYGPGEDALSLTEEYGAIKDDLQTKAVQEINNKKLLCQRNGKNFKSRVALLFDRLQRSKIKN